MAKNRDDDPAKNDGLAEGGKTATVEAAMVGMGVAAKGIAGGAAGSAAATVGVAAAAAVGAAKIGEAIGEGINAAAAEVEARNAEAQAEETQKRLKDKRIEHGLYTDKPKK